MIIKTLNRSEAQNAMKEWVLNYPSLPEVEGDYLKIRKDIQEFNQKVRSECPDSIAKKDYYIDAHIGIWWYVHLSWQGDMQTTAKVLETPCFTTDSILNLEERTGRKGTFINVYRYIMYYYSHIPQQVLDEYNKNTETQQDDLFRIVMKLNTAKVMVVDPALYLGGEKEYVRSLFMDSGVRV